MRWLTLVLLLLAPTSALAYLAPGTGSFVFQAVAAALIGGLSFARFAWGRIRGSLQRRFGSRRDG